MKSIKFVLIIFLILSSSYAASVKPGAEKRSADIKQMTNIVLSILQEGDYSKYKEYISPEAYVIYNNKYESINEVLVNKLKKNSFIEGGKIKVNFLQTYFPDEKSAYMVIQTRSASDSEFHWHSIYFIMAENNKWQIYSWHKS